MFRCYFESKSYTKDVMVKNQHFRSYNENKEIEYFQKFRSFMHFNSMCDVRGSSWPFHTDNCGLFEISIGDAGSMCTDIVIHQNEIFTISTCIWANVNIQDLVYVPESRQRAVVNDVEVRFPLSTYSRLNHD